MYIVCEEVNKYYEDAADWKDVYAKLHKMAEEALKCYRETMK